MVLIMQHIGCVVENERVILFELKIQVGNV